MAAANDVGAAAFMVPLLAADLERAKPRLRRLECIVRERDNSEVYNRGEKDFDTRSRLGKKREEGNVPQ